MRSASTSPVAALRHAVSMSADTAGASSATNRSPGNHPDDSSCSPARGWSSSQALHGLRGDEKEARMLQSGGPNLQQPHKRLSAHRVCHRGQLEAAVSCCVLALAEMGSTLGSAFTHARTNARTQPSNQWTDASQSRKRCNVHEGSRVCRRGRASVGARDERNGVDPLARPPREQQDQRDRPNKCRSLHHRCWKQRTSPIAKRKGRPRKLRPRTGTRVATARMSARHLRRAAQSCGPAVADPADDGEVDDDEEYTDVAPAKPSFFAVRFCVAVQAPPRFLLNACSLRAAPRCGRV
jgi:hypothetical protein